MNAPELQALRRFLFFSAAEAARYLAADEDRPQGVEERTWNRWESGKLPVPPNIAATVRQAVAFRETALQQVTAAVMQARQEQGTPDQVVLLWYAELDDWPHQPVLWRPHQSALAWSVAASPDLIHLVAFDARAFNLWRLAQSMADTPDARAAWAGLQATD